MAVFKCKMCGGDLEVTDTKSVIECDYCGTSQTIPAADDEKKVNLFNRANRLRFKNEFDKAEAIYESIVSEFPEEPEAYWGICLCKYGIEYVDDPATAKKIPTCHRTSFRSIFDEENYKLALEYADVVAQKIYRDEARAIDTLQKDILAVVNSVEPYDVFICYKETGEDGQRTRDSVLAQDIYDELTEKGLKVFFARITLEDKLGSAYEPYIFAALNSAKVMLVVGTKYEHFNAVWVKNEWSRYLEFMNADRKRTLIPCYKDMDAYDMPDEFSNLQAQDMNKIGAMQDLVRGVLKIAKPVTETPAQTVVQQTVVQTTVSSNVANLLKRGYMCLEEGRWEEADIFFERVLDDDAECSKAYIGKMLATEKCHTIDELSEKIITIDIENNSYYRNAVKYCKDTVKAELDKLVVARNEAVTLYNKQKQSMDKLNFVFRNTKHETVKYSCILDFDYEGQIKKTCSQYTFVILSYDSGGWVLKEVHIGLSESIEECVIADGVKVIGDRDYHGVFYSFYGEKIIIPNTVRVISDFAFHSCTSIKELSIPEGVITIGKGAFLSCERLQYVVIPDSVVEIGDSAFLACKKIKQVILPDKFISEQTAERLGLPFNVMTSKRKLREQEERQRQAEKQRKEEEHRKQEELRRLQEEKRKRDAQMAEYRSQGVCQHCGGTFKGFLGKSCSVCGKKKDY